MRWLKREKIRPFPELLDEAVKARGYSPAMHFEGATISYKRLQRYVRNLTGYILDRTRPGDRVAIFMPNCPQFVIAYLAIVSSGRICVPINFISIKDRLGSFENVYKIMPSDKITHQILDSHPSMIFVADFLYPILTKIEFDWNLLAVVTSLADFMPIAKRPLFKGWERLHGRSVDIPRIHDRLIDIDDFGSVVNKGDSRLDPIVHLEQPILIQYTGGTTGPQKGATLTTNTVLSNMWQTREIIDPFVKNDMEVMIGAIPFFHVYGLMACMNICLLGLHSTLVIMPTPDPKKMLSAMAKYKVTLFPGVNKMFDAVTALASRADLKRELKFLRLCVSGAGPIDESVVARFNALTEVKILRGYGLSEASPIVSVCLPGDVPESERGSMIGNPVPNTKIRIVNQLGQDLSEGEIGDIWVNGPQIMAGYWGRPEETERVIKITGDERWLKTGDIGYILNGKLYFVGRDKDMTTINGENVYHCDVERYILALEGIHGVALISIPDQKSGEAIVAVIAFRTDYQKDANAPDRIKARINGMSRNKLYVPKEIIIIGPEEFDALRNELGKVDRNNLKKFVSRHLGLELL
jgi:long-chain acyl-CoA synthetase